MKSWNKPTAALLTAFVFWFGFLEYAPAVYAGESSANEAPVITLEGIDQAANEATRASGEPCSKVPFANLLADPVERNWEPDHKEYKILTLTEENCGMMKTGSGGTIRTRLRKGTAIAVPLDGTGEWRVVACGNPYAPEGRAVGKYFECPTCPPPEVRTIEVPGPAKVFDLCRNLDGLQGAVPSGMVMDENGNCNPQVVEKRRIPWGWIGAVVAAIATGIALSKRGSKKDCPDCCPTCPPRRKPG